ncbi:MAG: type II toxin-antitoxin system RelE/ParE family toxin [Ekhidna sp.]|nr:type II toxin-antitoxin system RelE/ParE family toxin [Ekhidna sp.]
MALEIVWTKRAQNGYENIINYIKTYFSDKEVRRFVHQSNEFLKLLSQYPELLESTKSHKNLHRGPINKYTILTYRIKPRKKQIELINIRSVRQKPLK